MEATFVRVGELGALEAALRCARCPSPGGFSSTAQRAWRRLLGLQGVRILRASGEETGTALAYGVVDQLLRGLPEPLPDPLPSLRAAKPSADPLTVGAALVDLLGVLQDDGPVAVVVDDGHGADTPSLHALVFAFAPEGGVVGVPARREAGDNVTPERATRPSGSAATSNPASRSYRPARWNRRARSWPARTW